MNPIRHIILLAALSLLGGCASLISSATQNMAENLSEAMLNQDDPETVKAAAPAYLIMLDSLVRNEPDNVATLISASRLYGSYTSAFVVDDTQRAKRLAQKSLDYARSALCLELPVLCDNLDGPVDALQNDLQHIDKDDVPVLYAFAGAWTGWVQANAGDWNAIAQIPKLTLIFNRIVQLDENHDHGGAHLYLGVLHSQLPPSVGGKPAQARLHFEKARSLSAGSNLMVNVLFAEHYARLVFDQELHDQLLNQVIRDYSDKPGHALINALARSRAEALLSESGDFF